MATQDIDWERLNHRKFFLVGVGLFSGVTTTLFPLSVIKTRQMAAHNSVAAGLSGTKHVASTIWKHEGIRGFYRGFGTVLVGTIPGRTIYMTSLEMAKSATTKMGRKFDIDPIVLAGISSFVGGASGSLSTQAVVVPIDVVSQRLMVQGTALSGAADRASSSGGGRNGSGRGPAVAPSAATAAAAGQQQPAAAAAAGSSNSQTSSIQQQQQQQRHYSSSRARSSPTSSSSHNSSRGTSAPTAAAARLGACNSGQLVQRSMSTATAGAPHMNGFAMARLIVQQEGLAGLYRGFWPSVATFVPSNAIWWGSYGFYKRALWRAGSSSSGSSSSSSSSSSGSSVMQQPSTAAVVAVQALAGIMSGCTAALLTNPLDLVKTRLQVAEPVGGVVPSWGGVVRELLAEEGPRGLLRGVVPRMASSAMWGTAMVTTYEFLKSICALPLPPEQQ